MSLSLDELLWRNALAAAPAVPDADELMLWAPLFDADDAALLRDCAALQQGFSPEAVRRRGLASAAAVPAPGDWGPHVAAGELRDIARRMSAASPGKPASSPHAVPIPPADLAAVGRELVSILSDESDPDAARLTQIMRGLAAAAERRPAIDYRRHADAAMPLLARMIAVTCLCDLALRLRDLSEGPLGSPMLLHRAARFSSGGLGPYFDNVRHLARHSRDVFDLARIAAGVDDEEAVGVWIAILSRGCAGPLLDEIVDDLGDYAAYAPLSAILDRTVSRLPADVDLPMVARVRDAALDNGNMELAARAQTAVIRLRPDSLLEHEILGDISATGGNLVDALEAYRACQRMDSGHQGVRARMETLGTAAFAPFLVERGFGSPAERAETRLYRRGVPPLYAQRRGSVTHAVDVA